MIIQHLRGNEEGSWNHGRIKFHIALKCDMSQQNYIDQSVDWQPEDRGVVMYPKDIVACGDILRRILYWLPQTCCPSCPSYPHMTDPRNVRISVDRSVAVQYSTALVACSLCIVQRGQLGGRTLSQSLPCIHPFSHE